jgi:hypothetical protein
MTAFQVGEITGRLGFTPRFVVAVMVQGDWFTKGRGHIDCPAGWERW